jgi:RND family efflux transporter MFP subunit
VGRRAPAVAAALACGLVAGACGKHDPAHTKRPPPLVVVQKVRTRDVPVEVRAPVDLRPLAQADVASKTLGYLDAVLVDRGDVVKRGQLVALVRPSDLPDQLSTARGTLAQTQASVQLARANLERAQKLAPSGVISQQDLQNATTALATAEASQQAAQAQVGGLATRLGETRIESPLDGVVSVRRLDPGALVGPTSGASAILTVVRIDVLRVFIAVPEREIPGIAVGEDAHVELDALPGRHLEGKVVRIAPALDPTTRTLDAEVQLKNDDGQLRPGMYGMGAIVKEVHKGVPVVPPSALQISDGKHYVYVLAGNGGGSAGGPPQTAKVDRREIQVGEDTSPDPARGDPGDIEVRSGLKAGDDIVTAGIDGLSPGASVRVQRDVDPFTHASLDH